MLLQPLQERKFEGHDSGKNVRSVAAFPAGGIQKLATASRDQTIRVWDVSSGKQVGHALTGHSGDVLSVAVFPDGEKLVSGGEDKTLRIWNVNTGQLLGRALEGHTSYVNSVAVFPGGDKVASGGNDRTVRIWNVSTGQQVGAALEGHKDFVYCVAVFPAGDKLASGSRDSTVRIWDVSAGQQLGAALQGHSRAVNSVAVFPAGEKLVTGSSDKTLRVWEASTGQQVGPAFEGHGSFVRSVAVFPAGDKLVSGAQDGTVRIWDVSTGKQLLQQRLGPTSANTWVLGVAIFFETALPLAQENDAKKELLLATATGGEHADAERALKLWQVVPEDARKATLLQRLQGAGGAAGVLWPHARITVRGPGNAGKTSTIAALAGREFETSSQSTVGAAFEALELHQQHWELQQQRPGGDSKVEPGRSPTAAALDNMMPTPQLRAHRPRGAPEAVEALAMHAAVVTSADAPSHSGPRQPTMSRLDAMMRRLSAQEVQSPGPSPTPRPQARQPQQSSPTVSSQSHRVEAKPAPGATGGGGSLSVSSDGGPSIGSRPAATAAAEKSAAVLEQSNEHKQRQQGEEDCSDGGVGGGVDEETQEKALELVLKYEKDGEADHRIVLHIQDTGGQPVFLPVLDMLLSADSTLHMVVFSLPLLWQDFHRSSEEVLHHLRSVHTFAPGAPLILVGTRRDELESEQGEEAVRKLDRDLMEQVSQRCHPMLAGLIANRKADMSIFAIENSRGLSGDASIQNLVAALDAGVKKLPCLRQTIPVSWLKVYDALQDYAAKEAKQWMHLSTVTSIAKQCRLPSHPDLRLEDEVQELLRFLHDLNIVLWYGQEDGLENLVILDAQWLVDAATCIIRVFTLEDHCGKNKMMKDKDQRAIRQVPEDWEALTQGRGILRPTVRSILWSDPKFRDHQTELLKLLVRFGLAIPLPGEKEEHLVPALLADSAAPPATWPDHGAVFRVHFSLEDSANAANALKVTQEAPEVMTATQLQEGFLPIGAFHRLLAGILGSTTSTGWDTSAVSRFSMQVQFGKEKLLIHMLPQLSSIEVKLHGNGDGGVASEVLDRFRVLLREHLQSYQHLTQRLLAPLETSTGQVWVDIDVLMSHSDLDEKVDVGGQRLSRGAIKDTFSQTWLTKHCEFFFIDAEKLRTEPLERIPTLQEIRKDHPDWVVAKRLSLEQACRRAYVHDCLAVSHRWEHPIEPDSTGEQLKALVQFLREHERIKYVFYDTMSLPQGKDKTPSEKAEFQRMLPNINILYLGSTVLILADLTYVSRFWTLFEAWTSFQSASREGLRGSGSEKEMLRSCIVPLHSATLEVIQAILLPWSTCGVHEAHARLSLPDITVTNQSDKEVQLGKLFAFNEQVRVAMLHDSGSLIGRSPHLLQGGPRPTPPGASAAAADVPSPPPATAEEEEGAGPGSSLTASAGHTKHPSPAVPPSDVKGGTDAPRPTFGGSLRLEDQLRILFARVRLNPQDNTAKTMAWFKENGLEDLSHLKDAQMEEDLAEFLALPKGQARILRRHVDENC